MAQAYIATTHHASADAILAASYSRAAALSIGSS